MQPNLGLTEKHQQTIVDLLNVILADQHLLYTKVRNYHWNVVGPNFHSLHVLFEAHYEKIAPQADEIAERVRSLGGRAIGTLEEFKSHARLGEEPGEWPTAEQMVHQLTASYEALVEYLRDDIRTVQEECEDEGTADMLIALMKMYTKMAWMLRAHLERSGTVETVTGS